MKKYLITGAVCFLIGAVTTRYMVKANVETKIETVEIVKTKENTKVVKETKPDGTIIKETVETDNSTEQTDKVSDASSTTVTKKGSGITLGLLAIKSVDALSKPFEYGATVAVPLIGNLNVTGLVTTDKKIGLGVSIGF